MSRDWHGRIFQGNRVGDGVAIGPRATSKSIAEATAEAQFVTTSPLLHAMRSKEKGPTRFLRPFFKMTMIDCIIQRHKAQSSVVRIISEAIGRKPGLGYTGKT
jgi:hypothetical protein